MSENNESEQKKVPSANGCPLQHIPASAWQELFRSFLPKPFYKKHPISLILLILLVVTICISMFSSSNDGEDKLEIEGKSLALIKIKGVIMETTDVLEWIKKIEQNNNIVGVLLRVDSPGGGASASQELYSALKRLGSKKPLVVSMGTVAASGGYMISMAGERIFANASTITGSIGVRMDIPQLRNLLDKLGIDQETLVTGPYKDAGSIFRPLSQQEKDYLQGILNDMHEQFVKIVATGRKLSEDDVKKFATGRIYTGREAQTLGLIDEIGGMDEAHLWLAEKTGVNAKEKLIKQPKKYKWFDEALKSLLNTNLSSVSQAPYFLYQLRI